MVPIDTQFDEAFATRMARLETYNKHHYRPNSYLHKWWARRCGSTFRLILKGLVADAALRDYYAPGGLAGMTILDPMMGGGTTLHEAIRLGANVLGADIDPIPVLQARATLSDVPLLELERPFRHFYQSLRAKLEPYFITRCLYTDQPVPLRYLLYGMEKRCACRTVIVVDSLLLRQELDGGMLRLCARCHGVYDGDAPCDCQPSPDVTPIVEKGERVCPHCGQRYEDERQRPYYARYVPLVVVGRSPEGQLFFKAMETIDREAIARADAQRDALGFHPEDFVIAPGRKSDQLRRRGINNYLDLFSSRQLLYLAAAVEHLKPLPPLVQLNLGLLISTSLEFNSMLCGYKGRSKRRAGAIRHTFAHHAYSFPHMALENNPLHPRKASGTLRKLFQSRVRNGRAWAQRPRERMLTGRKAKFVTVVGEVDAGEEMVSPGALAEEARQEARQETRRFWLRQGSSTQLPLADNSVDAIVTDPPYFDSVQYSDLSNYFRVWLRQLLPDNGDWTYNTGQSAVDPHKLDRESRYRELLSGIFVECQRVLRKENGRFIFTFHHWNAKAWAALTAALQEADFVLVNRYVVHSENPISVHINNMRALTHDAILVCAAREAGVGGAWERPLHINTHDSETFCRDCATLLGWLLQTGEADSDGVWYRALDR